MIEPSTAHKTTCRLCLDSDENLLSVFEVPELDKYIYQCVFIKIVPSDSFPTNVCFKCITEVQNWTRFKKTCDQSQTILCKQFKKSPLPSLSINNIINDNTIDMDLSLFERESLFNEMEADVSIMPTIPNHSTPLHELPLQEMPAIQVKESENLNQSKVDPPPVTKRPLYVKSIERCYQAIKQHDGKDRFPARFRSYTCDVCSKSFLKFSKLIYHDQLKHKHLLETQGAQCDQCSEVFLNANRLDTHILMKHATRQHQCPHCMNSYVSWNSLRVHMYQHTEKNKCSECNKLFSSKFSLMDHMNRTHRKVKLHACMYCDKTFCSLGEVNRHERHVHFNMTRYKCHACDVETKTRQALDNHILCVHTETKSFACDQCVSYFKTNSALLQHKRKMHDEFVNLFSCPLCGEVFRSHQGYKIHVRKHRREGRTKYCFYCERAFVSKFNLAQHIRRIHTVPNQKCQVCGRAYRKRHKCRIVEEVTVEVDPCMNKSEQCVQQCMNKSEQYVQPCMDESEQYVQQCMNKSEQYVQPCMDESEQYAQPCMNKSKRYACSLCARSYSKKYNLQRHVLSFHVKPSDEVPCDGVLVSSSDVEIQCDKGLKDNESLCKISDSCGGKEEAIIASDVQEDAGNDKENLKNKITY
ncbi:hypothetical protein M8J76_004546 [Diaphorina citri]|nr:hypothetical protein M8J75_001372 [Diaphorina citri]KAI5732823.1 hypothetical protein M8J76_004546 [Diaphorina citri]